MRERLDACQKALEAAQNELRLKEHRMVSIDKEFRITTEDIRKVHTEASLFREQIASLLSSYSEKCDLSEETIKRRISVLQQDNRDLVTVRKALDFGY